MNKQKWIPGTIQKATAPVSYVVLLANGVQLVRRHVDSIKAWHTNTTLQPTLTEISIDTASDIASSETVTPVTTTLLIFLQYLR